MLIYAPVAQHHRTQRVMKNQESKVPKVGKRKYAGSRHHAKYEGQRGLETRAGAGGTSQSPWQELC